MERITSRQNAVVKRFRALARSAPAAGGEILLDGEHLLEEALASRVPVDVAAFSHTRLNGADRNAAAMARRLQSTGARVLTVSEDVFAAISPVREPSGAVAIARIETADLASAFRTTGGTPLVLVLASVQDPGNVGAIVRSAAAFGATAVVATQGTASPFGWKALRGAMGGTFRLPVAAGVTLDDVMTTAQAGHVPLIATVPRGGTPLPDVKLRRACAIVLGSEGAGLPDAVIVQADVTVSVPIARAMESLNVATAAAIVLYEASRQRTERR